MCSYAIVGRYQQIVYAMVGRHQQICMILTSTYLTCVHVYTYCEFSDLCITSTLKRLSYAHARTEMAFIRQAQKTLSLATWYFKLLIFRLLTDKVREIMSVRGTGNRW